MNVQIETALKRARGYWLIDGFTEIAGGGLLSLLAVLLLVSGSAPQAAFYAWLLSVAGEITIAKLAGLLVAGLLVYWLKDHFTYPRTGFVRGQRPTTAQVLILSRNILLFLLLPIAGLLAASLLISSAGSILATMPGWFPAGLGLLWAALCVLAADWLGLRRFQLLGAVILLAGLAIGFWQFAVGLPAFPASVPTGVLQPPVLASVKRTLESLAVLILTAGVTMLLSGLVTFLRYRKENPRPAAEEG